MRLRPGASDGRYFAAFARPQNVIYPGLLAACTAIIAGATFWHALACYLFFLSIYACAVGYNNLRDYKTDKINKRTDNPLLSRVAPRRVLLFFFAFNIIVLVALQFMLVQPVSLLITAAYIVCSLMYSHSLIRLQARGLLGTAVLALCYGGLAFWLGVVQGSASIEIAMLIALVVFQMVFLAPLLLAKDYKDVRGDKKTSKLTPLVRYGSTVVLKISFGCAVLAVVYFWLIAFLFGINFFITALASLIYVLFTHKLHTTKAQLNPYIRKLGVILMLFMSLLVIQAVIV